MAGYYAANTSSGKTWDSADFNWTGLLVAGGVGAVAGAGTAVAVGVEVAAGVALAATVGINAVANVVQSEVTYALGGQSSEPDMLESGIIGGVGGLAAFGVGARVGAALEGVTASAGGAFARSAGERASGFVGDVVGNTVSNLGLGDLAGQAVSSIQDSAWNVVVGMNDYFAGAQDAFYDWEQVQSDWYDNDGFGFPP